MPSRNHRVLALIALLALTSVAVGAFVFLVADSEQNQLDGVHERIHDLDAIVGGLTKEGDDQESALDDYVMSREEEALSRFEEAVALETGYLDRLHTERFEMPTIEAAVEALGLASRQWRENVAAPAIAAVRAGDTAALQQYAHRSIDDHALFDSATTQAEHLIADAEASLSERETNVGTIVMIGAVVAFLVLIAAFVAAIFLVRRFGRELERDALQAGILNRFTEVAEFAVDDRDVARTNLIALGRLVRPDASVTHVLNRSKDRALPEAVTGGVVGEILPLHALGRCAGLVRGAMHVTDDLSDDLSVHCPIYPASAGTLACIPLNSGEPVGAFHLYWNRANALPLGMRSSLARITEHAALAIGNRRLLAALQGQANTDPRTGLANSRAFDKAVEEALASRAGHETLSVLMLDVDQFKAFNDRHGHPAGDEALRAFAGVLRSCMREGDIAARYGGEEFAVLLPGVEPDAAMVIAERIRTRTETTIISLAPGLTDRITVSIGMAAAPTHATERVPLLQIADEALYRAKESGRNRVATVEILGPSEATRNTSHRPRRPKVA